VKADKCRRRWSEIFVCSCIGNGRRELSGDRCPVEVISCGVICASKASSRTPPGVLAIYRTSVHGESLKDRGRDLVTTKQRLYRSPEERQSLWIITLLRNGWLLLLPYQWFVFICVSPT